MTISSSFVTCLLSPPSLHHVLPYDPVAAAKPPSVSPEATLAGKRIFRAGFDPDIIFIMATLLDPDSETNDAVKKDLETFSHRVIGKKLNVGLI
jgi:hypothetical protein